MARLFYALLVGLVGAGIVHAVILILLPGYSERDAWSRLSLVAEPYAFAHIGRGAAPVIRALDPLFDTVACRFDLADGVVHVHAPDHVPFWSASVYNRQGQNIYSLTDRTATDRALDFVIVTPAQMIELRKSIPADFGRSVFIEADVAEGIVVVRAFAPDASWAPVVAHYLDQAECELR